jgi:hypothetical protein
MAGSGLGFGGFLVGLGVGWYLFRYIDFSFDIISYLLILMGIGMILSGFLNRGRTREHPLSGAFGGVVGGLFLAVFLTQGFGIITSFTNEFTDFSSGTYRATDTFTLSSPVAGDKIGLSVESVNGAIEVYSWSGNAVKFDVEVRARGNTDSEAENRIANFEHDLSSELSGSVQDVTLSFPIPSNQWNYYSVHVEVYVPMGTAADYNLDTTNGAISLNDITGEMITLTTTNGAITFSDVEADHIQADTTNGGITGAITTAESNLYTTNGGIEIVLSRISGKHTLGVTNGGIDITVPTGSDIGYKINLDTSIGSVDANLPNMDYSSDRTRTKIGETTNYSNKQVQIEITAETTVGGISLN